LSGATPFRGGFFSKEMLDIPLLFLYNIVTIRNKTKMTVTTNELGQQNMWAKEPQMVYQEYNRKGLLTPMQTTEMYNGRWAMIGIVAGAISYVATGKLFFGIF
jgi:hypothetical protein